MLQRNARCGPEQILAPASYRATKYFMMLEQNMELLLIILVVVLLFGGGGYWGRGRGYW